MPLLPRALRPSVIIRRKAMYAGFLGQSTFWKFVGIFVFGKASIKKFFGKNPEVIDVSAMGPERFMTLITAKPVTRRRRRKLAKQGIHAPTLNEHKAYAHAWVAEQEAAKRAS